MLSIHEGHAGIAGEGSGITELFAAAIGFARLSGCARVTDDNSNFDFKLRMVVCALIS